MIYNNRYRSFGLFNKTINRIIEYRTEQTLGVDNGHLARFSALLFMVCLVPVRSRACNHDWCDIRRNSDKKTTYKRHFLRTECVKVNAIPYSSIQMLLLLTSTTDQAEVLMEVYFSGTLDLFDGMEMLLLSITTR